MASHFMSEHLNGLKAALDGDHLPPQYFDSFLLNNFMNGLNLEEKENVFTIRSPKCH